MLNSAGLLQQLAQTQRGFAQNDADTILRAGDIVRGQQQLGDDANYQEFQRQVGYPMQQLSAAALPFGLYPSMAQGGTSTGQTTARTNSKSKGAGLAAPIPFGG